MDRFIILCKAMTEEIVLPNKEDSSTLTLCLQGLDFKLWINRKGETIQRIFVRSPAPLFKLWANKGLIAQKVGVLFRFIMALTNLKLYPAFYQSALTVALLIRGWDAEKDQKMQPLVPNFDSIDPTLVIWLNKLGFTENEDIRRLADCTGGSLRLGMLALNHALPRKPRSGRRCVPQSKSSHRRREVITSEEMGNIRALLKEIQSRINQPGSLSQEATLPGASTNQQHIVSKPATDEPVVDQSPTDERTMDEDVMDELLEAVDRGSITINEPLAATHENDLQSLLGRSREIKPYKMTFRRQCELLNGAYYSGSETNKGSYSNYSFNVQHTTLRIRNSPPGQKSFFIQIENVPAGEEHSEKYATKATEDDPGARIGIRVSLRDENGDETFSQYPKSSSWQARAVANSLFDQLAGHDLEDICLRQVRYVFIDKRLLNVPQILEPFRNGAYRDHDGKVVTFQGKQKIVVA